jgi:multidrug resistance efflux pump
MKAGRLVLINVLVLVGLAIVAALVFYYYSTNSNYVTSADASISATTVPVVATAPGKLATFTAAVGQHVRAGQVIGTEAIQVQSVSTGAKGGTSTGVPSTSTISITAPVAGDVATTSVAAGQVVGAGTPLVTLVQLNTVYVTANIPETKIQNIHKGEAVDVTVNAVPNVTFHGTVVAVAPATQSFFSLIPASATAGTYVQTTQRIPVIIRIHTMGYRLLPGESSAVRIHT